MDPRPDSLQIATKKVVHEVCECLGNKITDAVTKPNMTKMWNKEMKYYTNWKKYYRNGTLQNI